MRPRITNLLWGLFFIMLGIGITGDILSWWDFNLFFDGWWTLFIIIPCLINMINHGPTTGSITGILIGLLLFLSCQGVIEFYILRKLLVPIILILIGLSIIFRNVFSGKFKFYKVTNLDPNTPDYNAIFSSINTNLDGQNFSGAEINAVFGGVTLRLENAIITEDVVINTSAIFGGIDLYIPNNVNVKVSCTPIFGGVDNKRKISNIQGAPTIYLNATCMFGGVDIR